MTDETKKVPLMATKEMIEALPDVPDISLDITNCTSAAFLITDFRYRGQTLISIDERKES